MHADVRDPMLLGTLSPGGIAAYLRANGWDRVDSIEGKATVWAAPGDAEGAELIVPTRTDVGDYSTRMADVLAQVARQEGRPRHEVFLDLCESPFDVVRIRVVGQGSGPASLPIQEGVELIAGAREMLMAAACAAVEPRRAYPTRRPAEVAEYLDSVQLGQTGVGSFVVTLLSPVSPALRPQLDLEVDEPFCRRALGTLAQALTAVREASITASTRDDSSAFGDAVRSGVSADLCSALARMAGPEPLARELEVSIRWSPRRAPAKPGRPRVAFAPDLMPVLKEAARVFREASPEEDCELAGVVTALRREGEGPMSGDVTVNGVAGGELRKVSITLTPLSYDEAIRAHKHYLTVACRGDLVRRGSRYELHNAHCFRLLEDA